MSWLKSKIHLWFIAQLEKSLDAKRIDVKNRKINLGLYSIGKMFFTPKDELVCLFLGRYFGYKFEEERIKFVFSAIDGKSIEQRIARSLPRNSGQPLASASSQIPNHKSSN